MTQDGFFMAKSGNAATLNIQDEELLEYFTLHHENDLTMILMELEALGGKVTGELTIPSIEI